MLWFLIGFIMGGAIMGVIFYFKGRKDALSGYADDIQADIRRRDQMEDGKKSRRYKQHLKNH